MKFRKKIFISDDRKELYYEYFDTEKPKTVYKFKNLTLYRNNDIGIDIENKIDRDVKLSNRYDNTIIDGCSITSYDFYTRFVPFEKCYIIELYSNLKIISGKKFIAYLNASDSVLEFEIDLSELFYDSFYIGVKHGDSNIKRCDVIFWYTNKNGVSEPSDSFQLLIDVNKYKKIVLNGTELPSELIEPNHMFNYQKFLLRNV